MIISDSHNAGTQGGPTLARSRKRLYLPILLLFLTAPFIGEMFGAALRFSNLDELVRVFAIVTFYGAGVLLIREVVRRWSLGWAAIICLGLAYGLIEEALTLQTIFHPSGTGSEVLYGRIWGTNYLWAVLVTIYHAVWSVIIPIALLEFFFPKEKTRPWLTIRETWLMGGLFTCAAVLFFCIFQIRLGDSAPLLHMAIASATIIGLILTAFHIHFPKGLEAKKQLKLRRLGLAASMAGILWFILHLIVFIGAPWPAAITSLAAILLAGSFAAYVARRRQSLQPIHRIRLLFGGMLSVILFGVLLVVNSKPREITDIFFQLILLIGLIGWFMIMKRRYLPKHS